MGFLWDRACALSSWLEYVCAFRDSESRAWRSRNRAGLPTGFKVTGENAFDAVTQKCLAKGSVLLRSGWGGFLEVVSEGHIGARAEPSLHLR